MTKYLIFDAGPIISMTMNGLLPILEKLRKDFDGQFIITPEVKRELVDKPLKIKKYELEALEVQNLIGRGILKLSTDIIPHNLLEKETLKIMDIANSAFFAEGKITLIQKGEASCLAFAKLCNSPNVIVIDERTTRLLVESPKNLQEIMQKKLHTRIRINFGNLKHLGAFKFIRSAELLYIAYKKQLFEIKDSNLLDALLYAVKFKGTANSTQEIEEIKNIARR